ncbi:MAG: histidine kinase dimerization/phosphoacceptor domain -containing protein, partial [Albidovulum sp.]
MTVGPLRLPRLPQKLGKQLALLLAVVLLPLTLISMTKSISVADQMRTSAEAALAGELLAAVAPLQQSIQEARGAAEILALTVAPMLADRAACSAIMQKVKESSPIYGLAGFIEKDGKMQCSSHDATIDFSTYRFFSDVSEKRLPALSVNRLAPVSGTSVLGVSYPVFDAAGGYIGFIYLSLKHDSLERRRGGARPLDLFTFDRDGDILTASVGLEKAFGYLPGERDLKKFMGVAPETFSTASRDRGERTYSVFPLVPGEVYVLGTWPKGSVSTIDGAAVSMPVLLPALIWLASLSVAWLGMERLVTRHVRKLSRSIISFAGGNRMVGDISVRGAPLEIREMADAYERMTESILRDEAEMENTVHQKEVLLREVHHRVKNNLQLIASIMNMQTRKAGTPEARELLKGLQSRVMSLATVHRELYQTTGVTDIHAGELIGSIARQTVAVASATGRRFDLREDVDDVRMTPDQAVPLALLVAEAVMNA